MQDNLHYLGDGKAWSDGSFLPCKTQKCETHLNIIRTFHYARKGRQQVYHSDLNTLESLLSMHDGAPISSSIEPPSVHLETQSVHLREPQGAPTSPIGSTTVHPYIQDIQDIQDIQEQESYVSRFRVFLEDKLLNSKLFYISSDLIQLLTELERKGTPFEAITSELSAVGEDSIHNPKAFVKARLRDLKTREPVYSRDNPPAWCGNCDKETRKNTFLSNLPSGGQTLYCVACDPALVNRYGKQTQ
jgi:hypothetical protein